MRNKKKDLISIYINVQTVILPPELCFLVLEMAGLIRCTPNYQCWIVNCPAKRIYKGSFRAKQ